MAIPKFLEDLAVITKLGDYPGSDNNLTTSQFKAKFDEGVLKLQTYINTVLIPNLDQIVDIDETKKYVDDAIEAYVNDAIEEYDDSIKGYVDSRYWSTSVTLLASDWEDNMLTAAVTGMTETDDVTISPENSDENYAVYCGSGVRCIAQATDTLTFKCEDAPEIDLVVNIAVWKKEEQG